MSVEMTPAERFHHLEGGFQLEIDGEIVTLVGLNHLMGEQNQVNDPRMLGKADCCLRY